VHEYFTEGQKSLQYSSDLTFMAEWPDSSLSSAKTHANPLEIYKQAPKGLSDCEKQGSLKDF